MAGAGVGAVSCRDRRLAKLASHEEISSYAPDMELSGADARDKFSDAVNRAAFGGEITYITRGRDQRRVDPATLPFSRAHYAPTVVSGVGITSV